MNPPIGVLLWWLFQKMEEPVLTLSHLCVAREVHPMPKVDTTLAQLSRAVFSKLDANSGFWQIPLVDESKTLDYFHCSIWKILF